MLIEAYATDSENPDQEHSKLLVRGNRSAEYHANAYDDEEELLRAKGLDCQCKLDTYILIYNFKLCEWNPYFNKFYWTNLFRFRWR